MGIERRNEVFSLIYICRSDCEGNVRQRAQITWKGLVYNSSKMLRTILDALMHLLITLLSQSSNIDKQISASKSLGDLVRNAGQFIVPKIVPILESELKSNSDDVIREGVCLGLTQVLDKCHVRILEDYQTIIIDTIRYGLCDTSSNVRRASGHAFTIALKVFKKEAIDNIVPMLMNDTKNIRNVNALKELFHSSVVNDEYNYNRNNSNRNRNSNESGEREQRIKINTLLSYVIPNLLESEKLDVLAMLANDFSALPSACYLKYVSVIFKSVCKIVVTNHMNEELLRFGNQIMIDSVNEECTPELFLTITDFVNNKSMAIDTEEKVVALSLLSQFVKHTSNNFEDNIPSLISGILNLFVSNHENVRISAWNSLKDIMSVIPDVQINHQIDWFRQCIRRIVTETKVKLLPGFCIPGGLKPVMAMFDHSIRNGSFDERMNAAELMSDLIRLTTIEAIKPYMNKIAGALIRICADRYPSNVKCAILECLSLLIDRYGQYLKGFYTPLQTTFVKVVHDPHSHVRDHAIIAITKLMKFSTKFDALLRDLKNQIKNRANSSQVDVDQNIKVSILSALSHVLGIAVERKVKVSDKITNDVCTQLKLMCDENDNLVRNEAGMCLANVYCLIVENYTTYDNNANKEEIFEQKQSIIRDLIDLQHILNVSAKRIEFNLSVLSSLITNMNFYHSMIHHSLFDSVFAMISKIVEQNRSVNSNNDSSAVNNVLVLISALRVGYALLMSCALDANDENISANYKHTQQLTHLLLPCLQNSNEAIVQSSVEYLCALFLSINHQTECAENDNGIADNIQSQIVFFLLSAFIPVLVTHHSHNICVIEMRKGIQILLRLKDGTKQFVDQFISGYSKKSGIANSDKQSVIKELILITDAILATS